MCCPSFHISALRVRGGGGRVGERRGEVVAAVSERSMRRERRASRAHARVVLLQAPISLCARVRPARTLWARE